MLPLPTDPVTMVTAGTIVSDYFRKAFDFLPTMRIPCNFGWSVENVSQLYWRW
uniref:Uncharacterized protein n=1 Tax=Anguilla anguilla TaxID=7936 RepID=A0A0E9PYR0_ANGAN